jgi:hypothetical protein
MMFESNKKIYNSSNNKKILVKYWFSKDSTQKQIIQYLKFNNQDSENTETKQ